MITFKQLLQESNVLKFRQPPANSNSKTLPNLGPDKFYITQDTMDIVKDIKAKRAENASLDKKSSTKSEKVLEKRPDVLEFYRSFGSWFNNVIVDRPTSSSPEKVNVEYILRVKNNKTIAETKYSEVERFLKNHGYKEGDSGSISFKIWVNPQKGYGALVTPTRGGGITGVEFAPIHAFVKMGRLPKMS